MRDHMTYTRIVTAFVFIAVLITQPLSVFAGSMLTSPQGMPEYENAYSFEISQGVCDAGDNTHLEPHTGGGISASATASGGEAVSLTVKGPEDFDSSVIGKNGAALELGININDINGFLDSSGNVIGGSVTLTVYGIVYGWSLDDVGITAGENRVRLNIRTAAITYPVAPIFEDDPEGDAEVEEDVSSEPVATDPVSITVTLKKLPSKASASFVLETVSVVLPRMEEPDEEYEPSAPDNIGKNEFTVALIAGIVLVAGILIFSAVMVRKDLRKKRKKRRESREKSDS